MPHWSLCPMLFPTLLWFYFLLKKNDKKDQKIEKCEGECQFFCLHRLFMLVLWILVRRIEARKSRCCLKSYLKGGWSEEMTQCQGKPVIVVFHDLVQSDIQQLDSCIPFQVLMVYWHVCLFLCIWFGGAGSWHLNLLAMQAAVNNLS